MMPGIFQHVNQMGCVSVGGIDPPSFEVGEDDDHDVEFAQSRKQKKKQSSMVSSGAAKAPDFKAAAEEDDSLGDEFDDDEVDLFSAPMNSEAFMAKIAAQQKKLIS